MIKNMFVMTRKRLILDVVLILILLGLVAAIANVIRMPGETYKGSFGAGNAEESAIEAHLRTHIYKLAGEIGQRNSLEALSRSQHYITSTLAQYGYKTTMQEYIVDKEKLYNLEAELPGVTNSSEIVLIGAHYDSVVGSPGANDNGSGVATVLELARMNAEHPSARTIRFVFFGSEEPPFFHSQEMGSYHYAERCYEHNEKLKGLVVMETLGYYADKPNSQKYPADFVPGYPTTGNFLAFVGNQDSRSLVEECVGTFRTACKFPSEGVCAPNWVVGVDWSDQLWFWNRNYPAVMITDTAPYRYPFYHTLQDTPDKLNYPCFARVVKGLSEVLHRVSN